MQNSSSMPVFGPDSGAPASQPTLNQYKQQNQQILNMELKRQIDEKKQLEMARQQKERYEDLERLHQQQFQRGGGGAPLRDEYGNIRTTRRNPYNPNYQSGQFFGQNQQQLQLPTQPLSQSSYQPTLLSVQPQPQYQNDNLSQSQVGPLEQLQAEEKRQRQLMLQRELQNQMDYNQRRKDDEKERIKREKELDDLRIIKERQELEQRMRDELNMNALEKRNLQETNFDIDGLQAKRRLEQLRLQNQLIEQQNKRNAKTIPQGKRVRTPVNEAELSYRDYLDDNLRQRIELKLIKELPIEVEKTVKDTVNIELSRLRQEMGYQNNHMTDQVIQLKGQLIRQNELRHESEEQIRKLKEELKQTQIIDEIRQRELYNAFLQQEKTKQIQYETQRLMTPETIKFHFPSRPRPYYNLADPYLGSNDDANRDIHQIITDNSSMIPFNYDYGKDLKFDMDKIENKMDFSRKEIQEDYRKGYEVNDNVDINDDHFNRQRIYIPKSKNSRIDYQLQQDQPISKPTDIDTIKQIGNNVPQYLHQDNELSETIQKYQNQIESLDNMDRYRQHRENDSLSELVHNQSNQRNRINQNKEFYEYNNYYSPDHYDNVNFYHKMDKNDFY